MRIGLLGIGSPHGDDQIGWVLADALQADPELTGIEIDTLTVPAAPLVNLLPLFDALLVVDAAEMGLAAGDTVFYAQADKLLEVSSSVSSHAMGIAESWHLALALKLPLPQISLFLVQLAQTEPMAPMSEPLVEKIPDMLNEIKTHLNRNKAVKHTCLN